MFEMQVYICCLVTSVLFCFVTGHLEAFAATAKVLFRKNLSLVVPLPYEMICQGRLGADIRQELRKELPLPLRHSAKEWTR